MTDNYQDYVFKRLIAMETLYPRGHFYSELCFIAMWASFTLVPTLLKYGNLSYSSYI
jgi:hypothetical protein